MKRTLLSLLTAFLALCCTAQPQCEIKEYTIKDGLSQSIISALLQDQKGFMWFSTWNGLNKFDGYTFKKHKSSQGDGSTLITNRLIDISASRYGDIWCHTYSNRVHLFDSNTEKFIDVLQSIETEKQQNYVVRKIHPLKKGVVWIACEQGYNFRIDEKLVKENKGITPYHTYNNSTKGKEVYGVYQDAEENEWVMTDKGISIVGNRSINSDFPFRFIAEVGNHVWLLSANGKIAKYNKSDSSLQFIEQPPQVTQIVAMEPINSHTLAIGSNKGLLLLNTDDNTFRTINVTTPTQPDNTVVKIFKDQTGELWLFTNGTGIVRLNLESGEIQHLFTPEAEVVHYERPSSLVVFEDPTGYLWVLPRNGNLSYYNRESKKLESYLLNPADPQTAFHPYVRTMLKDKQGNIWVTSNRAVKKMSFFHRNYEQTNLDHDMEVRTFLRDSRDNFWVASKSGKVRIYDADKQFKGYLSNNGGITQETNRFLQSAYCMMEDQDGNIWIGTRYNGIYLLRKEKDKEFAYTITNYDHNPKDDYSLSTSSVYSIYQDHKKRIWVACYKGGVNLVDKDEKENLRFIHSGNRLKNYPSNNHSKVRHITQVGDSVMMVGTSDGLLTFSSEFKQPEEIKFYSNTHRPHANASLSSNNVMQVFTDSRKDIYLITFTGGINKVASSNLLSDTILFKSYTERDGLASDLTLSMIEDTSNQLWIVSENALTNFDPIHEKFTNYDQSFFRKTFYFSEAIPEITAGGQLVFGIDQGTVQITPGNIHKSDYIPVIAFTDLKIQGFTPDTNVENLQELVLKPSQRNITLQFAALDFTNSDGIRYAYRLNGLEKAWNYADMNRSASYLNIPKGEYRFEVRSTNSDGIWVENTRYLTIRVLPTFWETAWAWGLYLVLFIGLTGTIVYVLFYIYRLRHRIDMEQQLSNIKLRFFTDISHELRTPLTLISTPVTEVLEHEPLTPLAKEHLTLVQESTNRMLELVNQILDFRKIQNKKMKVLVEETEVGSLLAQIADKFRLIAEERHIKFELFDGQHEVKLWIDRDKFEKIFYNLLSNAFKYTPSGKNISIWITVEKEQVSISVIDEGIGIQPQKMGSLFQRFETLANQNMLQSSSGIGLSLVKELVELHHGNIEVASVPDKGSEFKVIFPTGNAHFRDDKQAEFILSDNNALSDSPEVGTAAIEESSVRTTNRVVEETGETGKALQQEEEGLSILIVEDNEKLRRFLSNILSSQYQVIEATNGREGLEKTTQHVPDIIISDVMMPVMDGLDMVNHIKNDKDICHIPIILLSAKSALDDRIKGLEYGIDDYITKPFSATYLKTRISSLLKQRKLLQERYMAALTDHKDSTLSELLSEPQVVSFDEEFLKQAVQFVEENIDRTELTIDEFANALMVSRTVFYRKLKTIVGLSPVDFIREIRVKRAAQFIDSSDYTFSQIAYMCGFNDPKYFAKCFKKRMGLTPSEYKAAKLLRN